VLAQAVDLLNVKDGVSFHERDGAFALLAGLVVGFGAGDFVGINDKTSLLAFADMGV
jgi:hypothetical protein